MAISPCYMAGTQLEGVQNLCNRDPLRKSPLELDRKAVQGDLPVADRHRPFLADVALSQVEQFNNASSLGKDPRFLVILCRLMLTDSMALVVQIILWISGG